MPSEDDGVRSTNSSLLRECLFDAVLQKSNPRQNGKQKRTRSRGDLASGSVSQKAIIPDSDTSELVEFSDYLAGEIFVGLPNDLKTISHQALQDDSNLSDKWSLPLSLSTYEEIVELVPPSVTDSLEAYGLINPPSTDTQTFISPVVSAYLTAATAAPPKPSETRVSACEICERDWVPMTYHHLIPKAVHVKVLKRGWHEEQQLNSVAWLCRACHSFVHEMASNEDLAKEYYTVEKICEREDVRKWAQWIGRVRWKKR